MIKLVIFDWNGVLLSDALACFETDCHIISIFGGIPPSFKEYQDTVIIPAVDFYEMHGCNREKILREINSVGNIFREHYEPRVKKCRTRKGVRNVLGFLKENTIPAIILSNHTERGIKDQLERLKIERFILRIIANKEQDTPMWERNKHQKLKKYLGSKNYSPEEVIIIGDSPEEVEIGKDLGIITVAITEGYYSTRRLREAKPEYLIHNISGLINIINSNGLTN